MAGGERGPADRRPRSWRGRPLSARCRISPWCAGAACPVRADDGDYRHHLPGARHRDLARGGLTGAAIGTAVLALLRLVANLLLLKKLLRKPLFRNLLDRARSFLSLGVMAAALIALPWEFDRIAARSPRRSRPCRGSRWVRSSILRYGRRPAGRPGFERTLLRNSRKTINPAGKFIMARRASRGG